VTSGAYRQWIDRNYGDRATLSNSTAEVAR
jgi:hypothetical protein